ncbi:tetracycline repressor, C-all-alpha domain protein [Rhodococcoides trifolii]|uniref:Tetracycline repressor, C-all-alpha domain protein n=1 Tax=Rhodococcoides trifolii TaxID=908250 RepID=A0A917FY15_9NOCA|nr:TetR/AcrR family transcriptional regulator C-terminal domain-containing protein [Rhodococcus trifolii]GGG13180.1 tetracycline repressor, C-all-alpha domain protein [Rhodococcus trifolii]
MGRPSSPLLSPDRIAVAALALVAEHGDFTVPGLAKKLKVSPSSLYNHVSGREQIVELLRAQAMSGVDLPDDTDGDWQTAVAHIARAYRTSYARYPRLIPLLTAHAVNSDHAFRMYNTLASILQNARFTPRDTLRTITALDSFVLGAALDLAAPDAPWRDSDRVEPALAEALSTGVDKGDAFEFGLTALLTGIDAAVNSRR